MIVPPLGEPSHNSIREQSAVPSQRVPIRRGWPICRALSLLFAAQILGCLTAALGAQEHRPLTLDDLFQLEALGSEFAGGPPLAFSPSGDHLAFVLLRPKSEAGHDQADLWGNDRADIWVVSTSGGEPKRVTNGKENGNGYWAPVWSPDGRRLALLSNEGGNIGVHVLELQTGELNRLTERGTQPEIWAPPMWISDSELVFTVLPEDELALSMGLTQWARSTAREGWEGFEQGTEATSSALESAPDDMASRPQGQLLLYDATADATTVLFDGHVRQLIPSPDGEVLAGIVVRRLYRPRGGESLTALGVQEGFDSFRLVLFDRRGPLDANELESLRDVVPGSLRWAPDGTWFAFTGRTESGDASEPEGSVRREPELLRFAPETRSLERPSVGRLEGVVSSSPGGVAPARVRWSSNGKLIVRARDPETERMGWWLLDGGGPSRNLTEHLPTAPGDLRRASGEPAWVGVSDGNLWRVAEDDETPTNLTRSLSEPVTGVRWAEGLGGSTSVVVRTRVEGGVSSHHRVDLRGELPVGLMRTPADQAELAVISPAGDLGAFTLDDRTGTYLRLITSGDGAPRSVIEANDFLRDIAEAESKRFEYTSLDGDTLAAWLLYPPTLESGDGEQGPFPLVTWVYGGAVAREDRPTIQATLNRPDALNLQLLIAEGYAVLIPSMPLDPPPSDPYERLLTGVLPAVDEAIALGVADPDRLALMGHSYGGYSVLGLITQTDRFHAAISLAGISNLASGYGTMDARLRYGPLRYGDVFRMFLFEQGQNRMGSAPWEDMERYVRNSPISYADHVETPLLLIHGDLDDVEIQQSEQFFLALYRQGKRARFVRYWGEGHTLASPANVRHMWREVFDWLSAYLH